jgi:hypothetical protein
MNDIAQKMTSEVLHSRAFELARADRLRQFKEFGNFFFAAVSFLAFLGLVGLTFTIMGRNPVVSAILALASSGFVALVFTVCATLAFAVLLEKIIAKSANKTLWAGALLVFGSLTFACIWGLFLIATYLRWL